jgi:hypothetical protein
MIAATRFLDCDHAAGHRRHDRGFAARHPPPGVRGWQPGHRWDFVRDTRFKCYNTVCFF